MNLFKIKPKARAKSKAKTSLLHNTRVEIEVTVEAVEVVEEPKIIKTLRLDPSMEGMLSVMDNVHVGAEEVDEVEGVEEAEEAGDVVPSAKKEARWLLLLLPLPQLLQVRTLKTDPNL